MRFKKFASLAVASAMTMSLLAGCGDTGTGSTEGSGGGATEAKTEASSGEDKTEDSGNGGGGQLAANHDEEYTVEFYNVAANFQGVQPGWYGKIVKDKFNMNLNIIAPQVSGDGAALYQTRCAAGNLGDLIILDNADASECVDSGLIKDLKGTIENYPNLWKFQSQIEAFNKQIGDGRLRRLERLEHICRGCLLGLVAFGLGLREDLMCALLRLIDDRALGNERLCALLRLVDDLLRVLLGFLHDAVAVIVDGLRTLHLLRHCKADVVDQLAQSVAVDDDLVRCERKRLCVVQHVIHFVQNIEYAHVVSSFLIV